MKSNTLISLCLVLLQTVIGGKRSSHQRCSMKKGILRNFAKFTGKHLCQSLFFNKVAGLRPATLLKRSLAQVFSCEYCETSKNTFFTKHLWTTASKVSKTHLFALMTKSIPSQ